MKLDAGDGRIAAPVFPPSQKENQKKRTWTGRRDGLILDLGHGFYESEELDLDCRPSARTCVELTPRRWRERWDISVQVAGASWGVCQRQRSGGGGGGVAGGGGAGGAALMPRLREDQDVFIT